MAQLVKAAQAGFDEKNDALVLSLIHIYANDEGFVTQYDKDNIEELGLLKMDFLGLRTLTVMGDALKLIKANRGIDLDLDAIPVSYTHLTTIK